jgi:dephospho-CoA kinase
VAFSALGIKAVDADFASRAVVQPGMPALSRIVDHFAEQDIISPDGHLNRPLLREIIFADTQQKQWLEALLHPLIRDWIIEQLHAAETEYVILESPLLFETDQYQLVDVSLVVDVPTEVQLERASARDNNDKVQIQRIIDSANVEAGKKQQSRFRYRQFIGYRNINRSRD